MLLRKTAPSVTASSPRCRPSRTCDLAVGSQTGLDDSLRKAAAIRRHPGRHRPVGFADHAIRWHSRGFHRLLDANDEVGQHSRTQLVLGVGDLGTDRYSMRIRIDHLVDLRNPSLEHTVGIRHHFDLRPVVRVEKTELSLSGDIRQHPFDRDIRDRIGRRRISRLHQEPGRRVK